MIQISQYLDYKYFDIIPILFCIIAIAVFINLIIKSLQKRKTSEQKQQTQNATRFRTIITKIGENIYNKIIPITFGVFLLVEVLLQFFPMISNSIFPADSYQKLTIKNQKDNILKENNKIQTVVILGRLSYSNTWIPIIPYSPLLNCSPIFKLQPNTKTTMKIRTGTKDIDHLIVAKLKKSKYYESTNGVVLSVPRNEIVIYTNCMNQLTEKPNVFLLPIILNIIMYFTAIIGAIWIFFNRLSKLKNKNIIVIILIGLLCAGLGTGFGFILWEHIKTILYFL